MLHTPVSGPVVLFLLSVEEWLRAIDIVHSRRKGKGKVLPITAALEILDALSKGSTQAAIALKYDVGKSTVSDFMKNKQKIREYANTLDTLGVSCSTKITRLAKEDNLEEALCLWLLQRHSH